MSRDISNETLFQFLKKEIINKDTGIIFLIGLCGYIGEAFLWWMLLGFPK